MIDKDLETFVTHLSEEIRQAVLPELGRGHARLARGKAIGGDTTFAIDEIAENLIEERLSRYGDIAYYSEDRGLVAFGSPSAILIIDPVDGSRPAAAGLEACCVSIAVTDKLENPELCDVTFGVVQDIMSGRLFRATKGKGFEIVSEGKPEFYELTQTTELTEMFWTLGFRGRPAEELVSVLSELIDLSSVNGAVFDVGSACFGMTRVATGQLDSYLDVGKRMIEDVPPVEEAFRRVGGGMVLNNSPYDIAAAKLIVEEAGCVVTDAAGRTLDHHRLLGSTHDFQLSCVVSSNWTLHDRVLEKIDAGIGRLRQRTSSGVAV